ncbi:MAG: DUF2799 domain-containing protein [Betaproteobacteria bacterium]|nr:DUF2799 domain-containing protein [Betaproteobacteria bacterium]
MKRLPARRPALARALLAWAWLALAACATMAAQACPITDWYAQGVADGRAGHASDRLVRHREACPDATAVPDERAWLEGRREGLADYCQPRHAVDAGLAGRGYAGVCRDPRYGRIYTAARRVHDSRSRVASIERDIAAKRRDIANRSTSEVRRDFLRRDVLTLESDRNRARNAQSDAEVALDKLRRELGV